MSPKITCYLDCVSPYSYFAFTHLLKHQATLTAHNIELDFIPIFLGGINAGSGNQPPWMVPAKAAYSNVDLQHAKRYFGLPNLIKRPSVFPTNTLRPQRGLVYIKAHHPTVYHEAFRLAWVALWENDTDISQPTLLSTVWAPLFPAAGELEKVLQAAEDPRWKKGLQDNTKEALECGAFGAPWFVVTNSKGERSVFFGSDRFHYMFAFLGLPEGESVGVVGEKAKL
ncbi:uncharacterized protein H6S33_003601 [Morchella sextelata]|uniref:uncharacterized protein n=1 Tax=Morchella sextelata TaxID=1174677 RepID=UPI001D04CA29|nr:uncharacterized protein H6S33_003601 [Morchella sextelata]KAH0606767.1 hypothetical protein H6S33_003601 [Morchella sextelata]